MDDDANDILCCAARFTCTRLEEEIQHIFQFSRQTCYLPKDILILGGAYNLRTEPIYSYVDICQTSQRIWPNDAMTTAMSVHQTLLDPAIRSQKSTSQWPSIKVLAQDTTYTYLYN